MTMGFVCVIPGKDLYGRPKSFRPCYFVPAKVQSINIQYNTTITMGNL